MPGKRGDERSGDTPRTDLPAEREPYYDGYFGTDEEEGVERERDAGEAAEKGKTGERTERERGAAEDAAGGDRGLI
jgi:hypothetical protein